jgi:hypothetical protein
MKMYRKEELQLHALPSKLDSGVYSATHSSYWIGGWMDRRSLRENFLTLPRSSDTIKSFTVY